MALPQWQGATTTILAQYPLGEVVVILNNTYYLSANHSFYTHTLCGAGHFFPIFSNSPQFPLSFLPDSIPAFPTFRPVWPPVERFLGIQAKIIPQIRIFYKHSYCKIKISQKHLGFYPSKNTYKCKDFLKGEHFIVTQNLITTVAPKQPNASAIDSVSDILFSRPVWPPVERISPPQTTKRNF